MAQFPDKKQLSKLSISKIREIVESTDPDDTIIELLSSDTRAGVRALVRKLENRKRRTEFAIERHRELCEIENELRIDGKKLIAGVDEAGRGPLAGPVVAAAAILPEDACLLGLDDSKKLTAKKREELFVNITAVAVAWGIGMVDNEEIDEIGILKAAMKAMRIALKNMKVTPDIALVDGNYSPGLNCKERMVVDGDARCLSVAAASVIAKVTRDRIMVDMDTVFPGYGFVRHKGYGSDEHVKALQKLGPCDIHRFSFKIVPKISPEGTASAILQKRLLNAPTRKAFEHAVNSIAHIKEYLHERDIEVLREKYRSCKKRFIL